MTGSVPGPVCHFPGHDLNRQTHAVSLKMLLGKQCSASSALKAEHSTNESIVGRGTKRYRIEARMNEWKVFQGHPKNFFNPTDLASCTSNSFDFQKLHRGGAMSIYPSVIILL